MNLTKYSKRKDRRFKDERVVPFTFYLTPDFNDQVRAFAADKDLTLTQIGNRALRLLMQADKVAS